MTLSDFLEEWNNETPYVRVQTSGSTGKPKLMLAEKKRMAASARATCNFLCLEKGDTALLCMPLDYIAGKMMVVRSIVCGLKLIDVKPDGNPLNGMQKPPTFAAMVPMQVYNSMQNEHERNLLMGIKHLIIGGGAVDDEMCKKLKSFPNAVWSTYGMTETLSHIAMKRLNGKDASSWYTPFENVKISLGTNGCLKINAPDVCKDVLQTNDLAELHNDGRRFRIIGRADNVICSGGIKMQIEDMEQTLKPHMNAPFIITKRKDPQFGEAVVMLVKDAGTKDAINACKTYLPKYSQPKKYIAVDRLPVTETGKPARAEAERMAEQADLD